MRIYGPNGTSAAPAARPARRAASGAFTLDEPEASAPATATPALKTIGGIDALLALQGAPDNTERRRRAVRQGRGALDALDALKISLLSGNLDTGALMRLKAAAADLKATSGEPGLDAVLAEIDLRVAVEIAKLSPSTGARIGEK